MTKVLLYTKQNHKGSKNRFSLLSSHQQPGWAEPDTEFPTFHMMLWTRLFNPTKILETTSPLDKMKALINS